MTPDDDEFAKWGHSFSSSHGRGSLLSADLSTKVGQHWNGTKNHYSLGLLPHTSRSQVHKCTEVNRLHCSFPGLVSPPKPGCHPHTARAQWSHGQLSAAAQSHLGSRGVNTWTLATPHTDNIIYYTPTSSTTLHCSMAKHCPCLHENVVTWEQWWHFSLLGPGLGHWDGDTRLSRPQLSGVKNGFKMQLCT